MEEKPRYSRVSDVLDLAVFMSSKAEGITINQIAQRYNVSRRTAERMRNSLTCIFPSVDEIETQDLKKHWGFINYSIAQLISFSPKEIANIEQFQRRTTNKEMKQELAKTIEKLKALNRKNTNNFEDNIELYMQTEGYALRQMPRYKISLENLTAIREALQNSKIVKAIYHNKRRILEPLGLVYGEKIYLIAREKAKGGDIYNYLLHKFEDIRLTEEAFDKGDFNLQEYINLSFGVYHGKILNVKLSFSPELKEEASNYNFHPTQKLKEKKDGSLTVNFKAGGDKEIFWHVFKWGKGCKLIAPKSLVKGYKKYLEENIKNYSD